MLEDGVHYGQTVTYTEVQQQNTTQVQIEGAVHPSKSTFQYPTQGPPGGWVICTAVHIKPV